MVRKRVPCGTCRGWVVLLAMNCTDSTVQYSRSTVQDSTGQYSKSTLLHCREGKERLLTSCGRYSRVATLAAVREALSDAERPSCFRRTVPCLLGKLHFGGWILDNNCTVLYSTLEKQKGVLRQEPGVEGSLPPVAGTRGVAVEAAVREFLSDAEAPLPLALYGFWGIPGRMWCKFGTSSRVRMTAKSSQSRPSPSNGCTTFGCTVQYTPEHPHTPTTTQQAPGTRHQAPGTRHKAPGNTNHQTQHSTQQ